MGDWRPQMSEGTVLGALQITASGAVAYAMSPVGRVIHLTMIEYAVLQQCRGLRSIQMIERDFMTVRPNGRGEFERTINRLAALGLIQNPFAGSATSYWQIREERARHVSPKPYLPRFVRIIVGALLVSVSLVSVIVLFLNFEMMGETPRDLARQKWSRFEIASGIEMLSWVLLTIVCHEAAHGILFWLYSGTMPKIARVPNGLVLAPMVKLPGFLTIPSRIERVEIFAVGPVVTMSFTIPPGVDLIRGSSSIEVVAGYFLLWLFAFGAVLPIWRTDGVRCLEACANVIGLPSVTVAVLRGRWKSARFDIAAVKLAVALYLCAVVASILFVMLLLHELTGVM